MKLNLYIILILIQSLLKAQAFSPVVIRRPELRVTSMTLSVSGSQIAYDFRIANGGTTQVIECGFIYSYNTYYPNGAKDPNHQTFTITTPADHNGVITGTTNISFLIAAYYFIPYVRNKHNTVFGSTANVGSAGLYNATAIGYGAVVNVDNTIQLGNTSVTTVVTSGTLSATGATLTNLKVTGGTLGSGRVLTSDASGNATWAPGGLTTVGSISATSNSNGATVSGTSLVLTPADASNGGVLTSGTQTIGGEKRFDKAVTNRVAYNASSGTSIDFSFSNLAYTTANPGAFTLTGIRDGGTYTLAVRGTTSGTASFTANGFMIHFFGNYSTISLKRTIYTFVVMGTEVYVSMVSEQ